MYLIPVVVILFAYFETKRSIFYYKTLTPEEKNCHKPNWHLVVNIMRVIVFVSNLHESSLFSALIKIIINANFILLKSVLFILYRIEENMDFSFANTYKDLSSYNIFFNISDFNFFGFNYSSSCSAAFRPCSTSTSSPNLSRTCASLSAQ